MTGFGERLPETAAAIPAPAGRRTSAALIDMLPVLALLTGAAVCHLGTGLPEWVAAAVAAIALGWAGGSWWGSCTDGRTIGKRLLGLAEVTDGSGSRPGPWRAGGRLLLRGGLALLTLGLAGLSYRWDPSGRDRTWWDRLTGTRVVLAGTGGRPAPVDLSRWAPEAGARDGWVPAPVDPDAAARSATRVAAMPPLPPGARRSRSPSDGRDFLAPALIGGANRAVPHAMGQPDRQPAGPQWTGGGKPAGAPGPGGGRPGTAELIWDTGRHVTVAGRVLIGRDPAPRDGERTDQLPPVSTDSIGVSKTHLHPDVGAGRITVTDRRSTNGVRVTRSDGTTDRCTPDQPMVVRAGDVVHFGGRFLTIVG